MIQNDMENDGLTPHVLMRTGDWLEISEKAFEELVPDIHGKEQGVWLQLDRKGIVNWADVVAVWRLKK